MTLREHTQKEQEKSFLRSDGVSHLPILQRLNWMNCAVLIGTPLVAFYGLWTTTSFVWQTWLWAFIYYFWTALGITAGYHRLWSHKSYTASLPLQLFLLFGGSGAMQRDVRWWSLRHRAHHRWTDTDLDPYNSSRGFWYAHVGWLLLDNFYISKPVPMDDLRRNPLLSWQRRHYFWFTVVTTYIFPTFVAWQFWGDAHGGFYIVGALRTAILFQTTWSVNSVAHYFGASTFDDTISPRDHVLTGLLTLGEGYHNFHHEFPNDYRNGIHWFDYDPTKWFIFAMECLGLASDLKKFPANEIRRGELEMRAKEVERGRKCIDYGVDIESLPWWTPSEWRERAAAAKEERKVLVKESGIVYDVTRFLAQGRHPGGRAIVTERNGKDVTGDFNGGIYNHTNAARNLMSHWRIARVGDEEHKHRE